MKLSLLITILVLASCSFKKGPLENQTQNGHNELYTLPDAPKKPDTEHYKRVVIAATNDVHGHYEPHQITMTDRLNGTQSIQVGGVDFISSYFKVLREQYGQVLLLDSGDLFSDKISEADFASDFYSIMGYDAITVGLKDFNQKLPSKYHSSSEFFKDFAAKSKTPLILSNLYELKTARVVEWPGTLPYLMREVNGVKVGIIGLIPDDIVEQTPVDNRIGLYVESMLQSTLRHSRLLRSLGAEIIVVMTHQGLNCGEDMASELKLPLSKVNFEPEKSGVCDLSNKMGEYLSRLPANLVDVVIGGRNHQKMANFVNTTLVMGNFDDGKSFSYTELFVDSKTKKIAKDKTVVHQPVMFCREFFKETNDCYTEDASVDHKSRTPAKFLGQIIEADKTLEQKFHYYLKTKVNTSSVKKNNVQPIMDFHEAQITYQADGSLNAKLILLSLTGKELSNILEHDFNQGKANSWQPSPFKREENNLTLSIQGSSIEMSQMYKVLVSIEDLQSHHQLKKFITRAENKSLNSISWNEPGMERDRISTAMSASETVR